MASLSFADVSASKQPESRKKRPRYGLLAALVIIIAGALWFLIYGGNKESQSVMPAVPSVETEAQVTVAGDREAVMTAAEPVADDIAGNQVPEEEAAPAVENISDASAEVIAETAEIPAAAPVENEESADNAEIVEVVEIIEVKPDDVVIPESLDVAFAEAKNFADYRRYQDSHEALVKILAMEEISGFPAFRDEVIAELNSAARNIAFGKGGHADKIVHTIVSGDNLDRLARRNNTSVEAIAALNDIKDHNRIMLGYDLVILPGPWKAEIDLANCELFLFRNGNLFMIYKVGVGRDRLTPKGSFTISDRVVEPTWTVGNEEIPFGDPRNVIGTRWMPLKASGTTPPVDGIGIHGTSDDSTVGKSSSNGCIRLTNKEVEELYMLLPINAEVIIR